MLSPRSRGKGSRRVPWRDGGRRKQRVVEWRKQTVHSVDGFPENAGPLVQLTYAGRFGRTATESIYLFDQQIARTGIRYQVELRGSRIYYVFVIRVPAVHAPIVSAIIAQIEKRYPR